MLIMHVTFCQKARKKLICGGFKQDWVGKSCDKRRLSTNKCSSEAIELRRIVTME